ncbi:MAG: family N-acetyltransferase [Aeromicrobium sp.]|nr:family N-acetyltransferase [Aeromicrobium sp.]
MSERALIRQVGPDDWADWRTMRQRSLSEDPQAFSSSTAMWSGDNDTEDRWRTRLADGACFVAYDGEQPVGMVAGRVIDDRTELISMWVAPEARRRRIGRELIQTVIAWADDRPLRLRVVDGNAAATKAYEQHGFVMQDGCDDEGCRLMWLNSAPTNDLREEQT